MEKSAFGAASDSSINKVLTPSGLVTPPERIKSKLHFRSSGHVSRKDFTPNGDKSFGHLKHQLPPKCRSNDSMNQVITPHGIITPPPRRFFNQSTLSLQNYFKNHKNGASPKNSVEESQSFHNANQLGKSSIAEQQTQQSQIQRDSNELVVKNSTPKVSLSKV